MVKFKMKMLILLTFGIFMTLSMIMYVSTFSYYINEDSNIVLLNSPNHIVELLENRSHFSHDILSSNETSLSRLDVRKESSIRPNSLRNQRLSVSSDNIVENNFKVSVNNSSENDLSQYSSEKPFDSNKADSVTLSGDVNKTWGQAVVNTMTVGSIPMKTKLFTIVSNSSVTFPVQSSYRSTSVRSASLNNYLTEPNLKKITLNLSKVSFNNNSFHLSSTTSKPKTKVTLDLRKTTVNSLLQLEGFTNNVISPNLFLNTKNISFVKKLPSPVSFDRDESVSYNNSTTSKISQLKSENTRTDVLDFLRIGRSSFVMEKNKFLRNSANESEEDNNNVIYSNHFSMPSVYKRTYTSQSMYIILNNSIIDRRDCIFCNNTNQTEILKYYERQKHMQEECRHYYKADQFLKTKKEKLDHILVDEKHKLLYCYVPKVACTNWKRIFMVLTGKVNDISEIINKPSYEVHTRNLFPSLQNYSDSEIDHFINTYSKFIFVRNPFERLLSAYRNKLEQHYNSSKYFQARFGKYIIKNFRKNASNVSLEKGDDVTFSEFASYLVSTDRLLYNEHWQTINDLCHPCFVNYDIIGKYETLIEDSKFILNHLKLNFSFPELTKPSSTATNLKKYLSTVDKDIVYQLLNIYDMDFKLFSYNISDLV